MAPVRSLSSLPGQRSRTRFLPRRPHPCKPHSDCHESRTTSPSNPNAQYNPSVDMLQSPTGLSCHETQPQWVAVQCAQREACDVLASEADCSGASLLAGLGDGDQQVERGADRFGQGEGRKIQGLHEAAVDAHASLLPALEFGLYGL